MSKISYNELDSLNLERYKNKLSIIDINNPFLNLKKPTIDDIKNLLNHTIWIRIKHNDSVVEYVCKVINIKDNNVSLNVLEYGKIIDIKLESIIGLSDITYCLNDNINIKQYTGKMVKLINGNDDFIECAIQDFDKYLINFAVRLEYSETLSYDLSYPINMIKKIELIKF